MKGLGGLIEVKMRPRRPKMAPTRPRIAPTRAETAPRRANKRQNGPRWRQDGPRWCQGGQRRRQDGPRRPQSGQHGRTRAASDASRALQMFQGVFTFLGGCIRNIITRDPLVQFKHASHSRIKIGFGFACQKISFKGLKLRLR